jgi:hypothetical protein
VGFPSTHEVLADTIRELLDGTSEIAEFCVPNVGKMTLHTDLTAARSTISKVRMLEKDYGVRIVLAHDVSWINEGTDEVLLSLLDKHMITTRERLLQGDIP